MSHPSSMELDELIAIANELREVLGERAHRVGTALGADPAFGGTGRRSESNLVRELAIDAISRGASRVGIDFRPVNGEGRELRCTSQGITRRYRVRKARRTSEGAVRIDGNAAGVEEPDDLLSRYESWVFSYTLDALLQIESVFVAENLGCTEGNPGHLILGPLVMLEDQSPPSKGFSPPSDDKLDGFDDEAENESGEDEAGEDDAVIS